MYKWGEKIEWYNSLVERGALLEEHKRPEVDQFTLYITAFHELHSCRPSGFSSGPIPFTAIVEYANIYEIEGEEFSDFMYLIRVMDAEYLSLEKQTAKAKNASTNSNKKNRGKG